MKHVIAMLMKASQKIVSTVKTAAVLASMIVWSQIASAAPVSSGFMLEQQDFDYFGGTSQGNSTWGRFTVAPITLSGSTGLTSGYVNMHVEGLGWAVQNLYVNATDGFGPITTSFDFGLIAPSNVGSLNVFVDYSATPDFMSSPGTFVPNVPVGANVWTAQGAGDMDPTSIGAPFATSAIPFIPAGFTQVLVSQADATNVQCATNQCFPMSIANSLQFLENRHPTKFVVPSNHVIGLKGDASLVGQLDTLSNRIAPARDAGRGVWFVPMLQGKFTYLTKNGLADKLVIKHQGVGYGGAGNQLPAGNFPFMGVTSESRGATPTFDFIVQELLKGEDVELVWTYDDAAGNPTGGHAVRVVEAGRTLGIPWLGYAHDSTQTHADAMDTLGLEVRREWVLDVDMDGLLNIGGRDREIRFVMSESVPEPTTWALVAIALAGLGWARRRAAT